MTAPYISKAADWIVAHQNQDGGWGETCASYMDENLRGHGSEHCFANRLGPHGAGRNQRISQLRLRGPQRCWFDLLALTQR